MGVFVEIVESRLRQVEESRDLDEGTKKTVGDLYREALQELESARDWADKAAKSDQTLAAAPGEIEQIKAESAALPVAPTAAVPEGVTPPQIEQAIAKKQVEVDEWRAVLAKREGELRRKAGLRGEISPKMSEARSRLATIDEQLQAPLAAEGTSPAAPARRILLVARRRSAEQEILCYDRQLAACEGTAELGPLRRDLATRHVALAEQQLKLWKEVVDRRRQQEAEQQLQQANREAGQAHPAIRRLAQENAALAETRKDLAQRIADTTRQLEQVGAQLAALKDRFKRVREKENAVGLNNAIGLLLRKQRETLPNVRYHRHNMSTRQTAIREGQLASLQLGDQRRELADLEAQVRAVAQNLDQAEARARRFELESAVREALRTKKEYLDAAIGDHNAYFEKLVDLDNAERQLVDEAEQCARYIDERVLWIASEPMLSVAEARNASDAIWWLLGPEAWCEAGRTLAADAAKNPAMLLLALCVFGPLIYCRVRVRDALIEIGEKAARGGAYHFLPTLEALLLTGLKAVLWPGLMVYLAWRLSDPLDASEWCRAVGAGLAATARLYLVLELLWAVCRPGGLGEAHFGWSVSSLKHVRQYVRWLAVPAMPLVFVAVAMHVQGNDRWEGSLGRLAYIAAMLCFSLFLQRVVCPAGGVLQPVLAMHRGGWLDRLRYVWYPLAVLIPLTLAVLAAVGYYYTAQQLGARLVVTAYLLLGLGLLHALLVRWILVNRRRLALEQARQRRAAAQAEAGASDEPGESSDLPTLAEPELDLAAINIQTRRFVQYALAVAGVLGTWFVWLDVAPALGMLHRVEIWQEFTLADVGLATLILATTLIAARNIPGLLEMAVLQHLPVDTGARYAIATVSRYLITLVGLMFGCGAIGLGWNKVQWLVAAMGVGLGFGLQEIFANFISGLIILFERPIRVGDVVTIDNITGKVSRIRMRATTVTDWDRKELIIPNKEFITGRVLNWTLTDQVNRVVINVGVAYGSNTELAAELLLKAAKDHPIVLDEPPPRVALEGFGDSSLNFVLRCFLPNLDNRGAVIHELHMTINRLFQESGIEMPFPQQDVHVRSIDAALGFLQPGPNAEVQSRTGGKIRGDAVGEAPSKRVA